MQPNQSARRLPVRWLAMAIPLAVGSCAGLARNDQGVLQPQTVAGPCQVQKFFLLGLRSTPTSMTVSNSGQACTFTVINAAQQATLNAALVTSPASHGTAEAGLLLAGEQAVVRYTPQGGYTGPDRFAITIEPNNLGITVNVTVQPPGAAHGS